MQRNLPSWHFLRKMTQRTYAFVIGLMLMTLCAFQASAHTWEIRVKQNQNGTLTWYGQSYHSVSECGTYTSGININGVDYNWTASFAGSVLGENASLFTVSPTYASCNCGRESYATVTTPYIAGVLNVTAYSTNQCWALYPDMPAGNGSFTPPPPPVCSACPLTGWSNTLAASGNNNNTACTPQDDHTTATIKVSHLACANITGDKQFSVVFDPGGANVSYGPFNYATGIETEVTINVPYGTTSTTPVKVIDTDFPCEITHGLTLPGDAYLGEKEMVPPVLTIPSSVTVNNNTGQCGAIVNYNAPTANDNCSGINGDQTVGFTIASLNADYSNVFSTPTGFNVSKLTFGGSGSSGIAHGHGANITATIELYNAITNTWVLVHSIQTGSGDYYYDNTTISFPSIPKVTQIRFTASQYVGQAFHFNQLPINLVSSGRTTVTQTAGLPSGSLFPKGVTTNTFKATDEAGNSTTLSFTVTVVDAENPTISAPASIVVNSSSTSCSASGVALGTATFNDNCPGATVSNNAPSTFPLGLTVVTWKVTDAVGRTATAIQNVTVQDKTAPVANATLSTITGQCAASVTAPRATDNCAGQVTGTTTDPTSYNTQGTYVIHWTYSDGNGNTSTQNQTVVVKDVTAPVANMTNLPVVTGQCSASVSAPTATDNCAGQVVGTTGNPTSYSAQGTYTITWTYNDGNGNSSQQQQTVIIRDNTVPAVTCAANQVINLDGNCSIALPDYTNLVSATDNCTASNALTITQSPAAGTIVSGTGVETVSFLVTDAAGNSTPCSITVTKKDVTPPTIVCVQPITVSNDVNACGAVVNYTTPTASDNCVGASGTQTFTYTGAAQTIVVPAGVTSMLVDAMGASGGTSYNGGVPGKGGRVQAMLTVTPGQTLTLYVGGAGAPGTTNPPSAGGFNGGGIGTGYSGCCGAGGGGGATDIRIGGSALTNRVLVAAGGGAAGSDGGSTSGGGAGGLIGGTPENGNNPSTLEATGGTQTSGGSGGSLGGYANAFPGSLGLGGNGGGGIGGGGGAGYYGGGGGTWAGGAGGSSFANASLASGVTHTSDFQSGNGQISLTWNSSSATVTQIAGLPSGAQFPIGTTVNTFEATDASGNKSQCSFSVTVNDTQFPVLVGVPSGTTVECNAVPVPATVTATDNCSTSAVTYSEVRTDGSCPSSYTLTRTWSTTDAAGNTTTASQTITVQDTQAPVLSVPANIVVNNDGGICGAVVSYAATATDNCNTPVIIYSHQPGSQFPVGATTVSVTATDACGNIASGSFTVTITDNEKPVVRTNSFTIYLDANGQASITKEQVNNGSSDNCGVASVSIDKSSFNCSNVGANTVTLTVTDIHGNVQSGTATITVKDNIIPTITCIASPAKVVDNAGCSYLVKGTEFDPSAADNCSYTVKNSYNNSNTLAGASFPKGTTTVTWTVTDASGNQATCSYTVTVTTSLAVTVANNSVLSQGVNGNTIYTGYTPASILKLTAAPTGGGAGYTYQWTVSNGFSLVNGSATQQTAQITSTMAGDYSGTVTLTVTDKYGCTTTLTKTIFVKDVRCGNNNDKVLVCQKTGSASNPWVQICIAPAAVAAHLEKGSTLGSCSIGAVTVREGAKKPSVVADASVLAYPNPSRGVVNLQLRNFAAGKVTVQVLDGNGKLVSTEGATISYATEDVSMNLSRLAAGVYNIKVISATGVLVTKVVLAK
ncbi:MAG: hypothetical protein JWP88_1212 [Flaviaesturariibacter sp.]|nr:hypothetical protein [Flaviaesturariibacter sp.]